MSNYKILVDSSVWIEYFSKGSYNQLDKLIEEDLVCTNELILTELLPLLQKKKEKVAVEGLLAIDSIPLKIDWEIIRYYQLLNLENGINKVGIPDLIILQQVIDYKLTFFSIDKHFKLMAKHLNFEIFSMK